MKIISGIFCFFILVSTVAFGDNAQDKTKERKKTFVFNLSARTGFMHGTSYEILYRNDTGNDYMSELQWELKPLFFVGAEFSMEPNGARGFFTGLDLKVGLPGKTGTMIDRDWEHIPGKLSHFSSHDNKTLGTFHLDTYAGYHFLFKDFFYLRPFLSFEYHLFRMEAVNGYYSYEFYNWENRPVSGPIVRYNQHWFLLYNGLTIGILPGRFDIKGSIKITPLVFCIGDDDHVLREIRFVKYMFGKIAIEPSVDVSFALNNRFSLGVNGSYKFFYGARGVVIVDEYSSELPFFYGYKNLAGAGLKLFEAAFYFQVKI